ncbi:MAG: NUDIX domain-containing protein [Lachnospiraceae bacterium]|nr:NUDIX domain-containing protein [Lachnospiraceae bacterium]
MKEYWDLYDAAGRFTKETLLRGEPVPKERYHKVVHIWVRNSNDELLIQKRSDKVTWKPGAWAVTSGSVVSGEDEIIAALREMEEELGLKVLPEELRFLFCMRRRDTFCYVYLVKADIPVGELTLQEAEVADAKWMRPEEIEKEMKAGTFHRYDYYELLHKFLEFE